jgi:hypothetical protein
MHLVAMIYLNYDDARTYKPPNLKQLYFSGNNMENIGVHCNFLIVWKQKSLVAWVIVPKKNGRKPKKKVISFVNNSENVLSKFIFSN